MTLCSVLTALSLIVALVDADTYLHVPRGSNNRLHGQGRQRQNNDRIFDSQNNARGGYNVGGDPSKGLTPRMRYYAGSILNIEWTNQHQCGSGNTHCDIIMQYMCDPELRDGTITQTIPVNLDLKSKQNGQHENQEYYARCKTRRRNENLYHADQRIHGHSAIHTRQNRRGTRRGLECPEERDYYPYAHPSPWKDVAILTNHLDRCEFYKNESQNVKAKGYCDYPTYDEFRSAATRNAHSNKYLTPTTKGPCEVKKGRRDKRFIWKEEPAHGIPPPECKQAPLSRDNHLGNTASKEGTNGSKSIPQTLTYKWKIPDIPAKNCVFRIRYNISIGDYAPFAADVNNDVRSRACLPTIDIGKEYGMSLVEAKERGYYIKNNPRIKPLKTDEGIEKKLELRIALNTAQTGRTFQDRSHAFDILTRPSNIPKAATIHNVQVRGKRGNIVQTYPATEYDFAPNDLTVQKDEYVHMQWTGSLRNPRNNAGEGAAGTDKSNVVNLRQKTSGTDQSATSHGYPGNSYPRSIHEDTFLDLGKNFAYKAAILFPGLLPGRLNIAAIKANTSTCIKEKGFCVKSDGNDQSTGVHKINRVDGNTPQAQKQCLKECASDPAATGCEVIWNRSNRGCYVHTKKITAGNNQPNHACWVFWKCKVPDPAPLAAPVKPVTRYESMGCFNDGSVTAISGEKTIIATDALKKCFEKALKEGNEYFAVENRRECLTSKDAGSTYKKYGKTTGCYADGTGGNSKMDVYRIGSFGNLEEELLMEPTKIRKGKIIARLTQLNKEYSIQFEVYPDEHKRGWHSVIHLTIGKDHQRFGDRTPGVWFSHNARGGLYICAPINRNRNWCKYTKAYPVKKWIKVRISQKLEEEDYYYRIEINGEQLYKVRNDKPREFKNVIVYAGDKWYAAQRGLIRGFSVQNHVPIQKGRVISTLPQLLKEYSVKFQVFPTKILQGFHNVLHLSTGGDKSAYGDRTPGVWFHESGNGKLRICSAVNGNPNHCFDTQQTIPVNNWTAIAISQKKVVADYVYRIEVNGKKVHEMKNTKAQVFYNVQVYVGDIWYASQEGYIRGLSITGVNTTRIPDKLAAPLIKAATKIERNSWVKTIDILRKEFSVEFEVLLTVFQRGWRNLIHFTTGGDNVAYGSRIPAIYFWYNKFYVCSAISGNRNYYRPSKPLDATYLNRWIKFKIEQKREGDLYVFNAMFDGKQMMTITNRQPTDFYDVKIYDSDPWYNPQKASIRNLRVTGISSLIEPDGEYVKQTLSIIPKQTKDAKESIRVMCRRPRDISYKPLSYDVGKMYVGKLDRYDDKFDIREIISWENIKGTQGRGKCQWIGWESNTFLNQLLRITFWIKFVDKVPPQSDDFGIRVCDKVYNDWVTGCQPNKWCRVEKDLKCGSADKGRRATLTFNSINSLQKIRMSRLQLQVLAGVKAAPKDELYAGDLASGYDSYKSNDEYQENGSEMTDIDGEMNDEEEQSVSEEDEIEENGEQVNDPRPGGRRRRRNKGNVPGFDLTTLNDAPPYIDLGAQKVTTCGKWAYVCTRNNNFSNRSQKGKITVECRNNTKVSEEDAKPGEVSVRPGPKLMGSKDNPFVDLNDPSFDFDF